MNDLILYTTEDGRSQIQLRGDQNTVWLTQLEMAEFRRHQTEFSLHLKNLFRTEIGYGFSCQGILDSSNRGKPGGASSGHTL